MKRLLVFHPALAPYRIDAFNALSKHFATKIVFSSKQADRQEFDQDALRSTLNVDHAYLEKGFSVRGRKVKFGIWKEITDYLPDVVMTSEFSQITALVAIRKVTLERKYRHIVLTDDNPDSISRDITVRRIARRLLLPLVDGATFISEETANYYKNEYNMKCTNVVVPILQEENRFRKNLEKALLVLNEIPERRRTVDKKIVLFVGRLEKEKRIDLLIRGFREMTEIHNDSILVIVGDGRERSSLKRLVFQLGMEKNVIFTGRLEGTRLYAWYCLGDVFVNTSEFEPFGTVVNEALISGMPVVCSRKAGAKILVKEGHNGSIVDPEDMRALGREIERWLRVTEASEKMLEKGIKRSRMILDFEKTMEDYVRYLSN